MAETPPRTQPANDTLVTRHPRRLAPMRPPGWGGGDLAPDRVGLYRRFTMGAARRGWRLAPQDVEMLLDIYLAYVRNSGTADPERCLRTFDRLRRHSS